MGENNPDLYNRKILQVIEVINMKKNNPSKMSTEIIQSLLSGDKNTALIHLNTFDKDGRSPLFYSLLLDDTALLNELILAGANINQQDKQGWATLHHAIQRRNLPAIGLLLKSGANLEIKDVYGNTPLFRAVFSSEGKGDIIKLYLDFGADIHNKNDSGISPIELTETIANYNVIQFF